VDIGDTFERMVGMLHCHASQFYEWLPFNAGNLADVPASDEARRAWLAERMRRRIAPLADRHRDLIARTYGERGPQVRLIEAFEVSEYGGPLDAAARKRLFPFLPDASAGTAFQRKEWVDIPEE
jgi:N-acetylglucosamine malate deacetylase 1